MGVLEKCSSSLILKQIDPGDKVNEGEDDVVFPRNGLRIKHT